MILRHCVWRQHQGIQSATPNQLRNMYMHTHLQENRERYSEELGAINKIVIFSRQNLQQQHLMRHLWFYAGSKNHRHHVTAQASRLVSHHGSHKRTTERSRHRTRVKRQLSCHAFYTRMASISSDSILMLIIKIGGVQHRGLNLTVWIIRSLNDKKLKHHL